MPIDNPNIVFTPPAAGRFSWTFETVAGQAIYYDEHNFAWLLLDGSTIGRSTSGAMIADNNLLKLYSVLWNVGLVVLSGTRTSPQNDWNTNKRLTLPNLAGRTVVASGLAFGLTARTLGESFGEETIQLTTAQLPAHSHGTSGGAFFVSPGSGGNFTLSTVTGSQHSTRTATNNAGSNQPHNNLQPSYVLNPIISCGFHRSS